MTANSSVVKITAKTALKNNWLNSIVASAILIFSYFICALSISYIAEISNDIIAYAVLALMAIFLLMPLALGLIRFFWRMIFGADDKPIVLFYWFSEKAMYRRALKMISALAFRAVVLGVILFTPAVIVDIFSSAKFYDIFNMPIPLWTDNLYYVSLFLKTLATVILIFLMAKYYLAPFLIVADENMEVDEAIHMSSIVSKNTLLDFICLVFSFFGWLITSVIVFPLIFTIPYFITALSVHSRFAVAEYNKMVDITEQSSSPTYAPEL